MFKRFLRRLVRLFAGPDYLKRDTIIVGGRRVVVRELTSLEYQQINDRYTNSDRDGNTFDDIAYVVSLACEDFAGMPPEKVRAKLSGMALGQINKAILRLSGLVNDDEDTDAKSTGDAPEKPQKKSGT